MFVDRLNDVTLVSSLVMAETGKLIVGNQCELHKISSTNILKVFWLPFSVLNFTFFFF